MMHAPLTCINVQMGSEAVAFEWYKDNYLRNIFDGRCLSAVSANRVDFVSCNGASRWETMVSAADNGMLARY
jgi:hypothetical protein